VFLQCVLKEINSYDYPVYYQAAVAAVCKPAAGRAGWTAVVDRKDWAAAVEREEGAVVAVEREKGAAAAVEREKRAAAAVGVKRCRVSVGQVEEVRLKLTGRHWNQTFLPALSYRK